MASARNLYVHAGRLFTTHTFDLIKFLILFFACLHVALAGDTGEHTCRIVFPRGPDSAPRKLHLYDGVGSTEVDLPRLNLSKIYRLRPGDISITLLPSRPASPEEVPTGAPVVKIPAEIKDFYLILTHDPGNKVVPVKLHVISANTKGFKRGEMLWLNLTKNPVAGMIGSKKLRLPAKGKVKIASPVSKPGNYPVRIDYRIPGKKHIYPLCETQWFHDPRSRSLAFVLPGAGTRTPRVMVFADFRIPEKKKR